MTLFFLYNRDDAKSQAGAEKMLDEMDDPSNPQIITINLDYISRRVSYRILSSNAFEDGTSIGAIIVSKERLLYLVNEMHSKGETPIGGKIVAVNTLDERIKFALERLHFSVDNV